MDENYSPHDEVIKPKVIEFESPLMADAYEAAQAYQKILETSATADVCTCHWHDVTSIGKPPMKIMGNTSPDCRVHSREGHLLGFVKFLQQRERWSLRYNPPEPDPEAVTLDVQSTKHGTN